MNNFKEDLQALFKKATIRPGTPHSFIFYDVQIVNEAMLVWINDMLASGFIPDLFTKDETDGICNSLRNEAKSMGLSDAPEVLLEYFINKIRSNLHTILCFSPVGDAFRIRGRKFPGLVNCNTLN
jgi:dynein heavy chain